MHEGWIRHIRIGREMRVTRPEMLRVLTEGTELNRDSDFGQARSE